MKKNERVAQFATIAETLCMGSNVLRAVKQVLIDRLYSPPSKKWQTYGCLTIISILGMGTCQARTYSFWWMGAIAGPRYLTPIKACDDLFTNTFPYLLPVYRPESSWYDPSYGNGRQRFVCGDALDPPSVWASFTQAVETCGNDEVFDFTSFTCTAIGIKGSANKVEACVIQPPNPDSFVGNPIDILSGNKMQQEYDFNSSSPNGMELYRTYNSLDGAWVHNFSMHLDFADDSVVMVASDGNTAVFSSDTDDRTYSSRSNTGTLTYNPLTSLWLYTSINLQEFQFNSDGRLISIKRPSGTVLKLSYKRTMLSTFIDITNASNQTMHISEDERHQLMSANFLGMNVTYEYLDGILQKVTKRLEDLVTVRQYIYDGAYRSLLTGIVDERGIRVATWAYDGLKRATSSEHAGAADRTEVEYGLGYSKAKNALGKTTVYYYKKTGGINKITAIQGEPSASCPASNSAYTYNDRGQLVNKTDARGASTAYTYNERGLENSRTEGSGTPLARTITTEWDPTRFLPTRIVEAERTTVYSYDGEGRELSRTTISN